MTDKMTAVWVSATTCEEIEPICTERDPNETVQSWADRHRHAIQAQLQTDPVKDDDTGEAAASSA